MVIGLVCVAIGSASMGLNSGVVVGRLLEGDERKRDSGFTLYYLGSTLGILIGVAATGPLQAAFGFHVGFGFAAITLIIGSLVYWPNRQAPHQAAPGPTDPISRSALTRLAAIALIGAALLAGVLVVGIPLGLNPAAVVAGIATIAAGGYFIRIFVSAKVQRTERVRVRRYLPAFLGTLLFCLLYQQLLTTIAIHSEAGTDRRIFGIEVPASSLLTAAPFCTIVLGFYLVYLWSRLGTRQPSPETKFAIGLAITGIAILALAVSAAVSASSPLWLVVLIVFAFGATDAIVSPTGISMATEVAPTAFKAQMLSLHYLSAAIGTSLAGVIAQIYLPGKNDASYFGALAIVTLAAAAAFLALRMLQRHRGVPALLAPVG